MKTFDPTLVAGTAASACGTLITTLADAALQLFGVPLQVVLASLTGSLGARVFLSPAPFWRAAAASAFWTVTGAISAQVVLWGIGKLLTDAPPGGTLAFFALLVAALGQRAAPIIWERGGAALERGLDGLFNKGGKP